MSFAELVKNLGEKYAKPQSFYDKKVSYGTAGFRTKAKDLDWVLYRMGLLAVMRSLSQDLKIIGCMITASHNPEEDNGCKLVDPYGDMMAEEWESYATELVNSNDIKATLTKLAENNTEFKRFVSKYDEENPKSSEYKAKVVVAHDTRPSCALLLDAFSCGVADLNGSLQNYGLLTTPQLHYMVRCYNTQLNYGNPTEQGYYQKLSLAFNNIWSLIKFKPDSNYEKDIYVDAANGIGAMKIKALSEIIKSDCVQKNNNNKNLNSENQMNVTVFNDGTAADDVLNHNSGADFVKVQQKTPVKLPISEAARFQKYCSFDGDADRIVYYYLSDDRKKFHLLDGDKIATLMATQFTELLKDANLKDKIKLCIVQTAYANGSSTHFIENVMNIKASCTPTGVKHLHHEAKNADIGVYFEANGHGTVIFSEHAESVIETAYSSIENLKLNETDLMAHLNTNKNLYSIYILKNLKDCINQTVGDAITDLLAVELILAMRNLSIADWDKLYTDLPSRQLKVTIKDRTVIKTTDAERRVSEPAELQNQLDNLIKTLGYTMARSFVRPSGTEDVVRVYAEADTQEHTDDLANKVSQLVYDLAGGVGPRP